MADGGFGGVLEIEEHTVDVTFNNGIVVTEVTQVFVNTEARQVEVLYTFPVPEGTSVANFSMWINGKEMVVEVGSPSHGDDFVVAKHADSYWQASLETDGGDLDRDVVIGFKTERPRTGLDLVTSRVPGEDGFFQLSFTVGDELNRPLLSQLAEEDSSNPEIERMWAGRSASSAPWRDGYDIEPRGRI